MLRNLNKRYKDLKGYRDSWYSLTANRLVMTLGPLRGEINADICVIGGGFTGISAAYELVQKGYSVVILEKDTLCGGASGKSGGQLLRGYAASPATMIDRYGFGNTKFMNNVSLEGLALILDRIRQHDIDCDLKFGHVTAATKKRHIKELENEVKEWSEIGHDDFIMLDKNQTQDIVKSKKYIGGLYDPKGAHFHPLNYALGVAEAAQLQGVKIYDMTPAIEIVPGKTPKIMTPQGVVKAKYVLIAGAVRVKGVEVISDVSMDVTAHMIATEPLGEERARRLISTDVAVADANFVMNYFRISNDYRLLFGGNCNYSNRDFMGQDRYLRARLLKVFPELKHTAIEHCWYGPLNFTINRMPHLGRVNENIFYAHGFGGHGMITTNILGKVMAEAVMGTAERFDVFASIPHLPFPGGDFTKRPLFVLGMTWYKLRDML